MNTVVLGILEYICHCTCLYEFFMPGMNKKVKSMRPAVVMGFEEYLPIALSASGSTQQSEKGKGYGREIKWP